MALLWHDGFENYTNYAHLMKIQNEFISYTTSDQHHVNFGDCGRRSSRGIQAVPDSVFYVNLKNNYTSFILGIASYLSTDTVPSYNASYPLLAFYDGGTVQLRLHVVGTEIRVYNGAGSLLGTTSGAEIGALTWRYIEVKFTIDNSAGAIEIRSNENTVLSLSSVDTQYSANAYFNQVRIKGAYSLSSHFDDLYLCDLTGTSPHNDFLGDVRIDVLRPNAAGTYTDFTPSAGANYQNVDESPYSDGDTTYNDGANVGNQDSYQMPDLPAPAGSTIYGVKSQITVRKTDAGAMKCKLLTRAGTTDNLGDEIILSDSFTTHTKILEDNPDDAAAWADADVNGMEVGVEITA